MFCRVKPSVNSLPACTSAGLVPKPISITRGVAPAALPPLSALLAGAAAPGGLAAGYSCPPPEAAASPEICWTISMVGGGRMVTGPGASGAGWATPSTWTNIAVDTSRMRCPSSYSMVNGMR